MKICGRVSLATFGVFAMSSSEALAEDWQFVTIDNKGSVVYLDKDSLRKDGKYTLAWEMIDAKNDNTVKYRTRKTLIKYDCSNEIYMYLMTITYSASGEVISSVNFDYAHQKWNYVVPGTIGETQFQAACTP